MDYILRYTNPKSDAEKKIVAKVTVNLDFTENKSSGNPPVDGKKYNGIGNGILEGLPTPYTNLVTNQEVPSTGIIGPVTEFSFLEIYGTSSNLVDNNGNLNEIGLNKMYMTFLDSVKRKLYQEYKKVYGLELYQTLSYETGLTTLEPVVEKIEGSSVPNQTDASLGQTASGVTASGTTASTQPPTKEDPAPVTASQSTTKLVGDYIFDITKEGYFVNKELGELKIVSKEEAIRAEEEFDFGAEDLTVSEEYIEGEFVGEDESFEVFFKDTQSTEGAIEDEYTPETPTGTAEATGSLVFDGRKFKQPEVSKRYPTNYALYIDFNKMPKPKLTKKKLIETKLKVEGGLTGDPNDSAAKSGYCPTLKNGKKYHTNKGITYAVWKNNFGTKNDDRFLNMNLEDWSKIFDGKYWNGNATSKYEAVNCLFTSFAWGGNKPKTVEAAKKLLGVSSLDDVPEAKAVAALLSARAQFFINISQPDNKNNKFRKGWINAINAFIEQTYF